MAPPTSSHAYRLVELVNEAAWLIEVLRAARDVMSAPWCVAAGAVRSLVWNSLHGFPLLPPRELDLVYFDASSPEPLDAELSARVAKLASDFEWDVVNQAHAHRLSGPSDAPPFCSLEDAISCWPETATAVGVYLDSLDRLRVVAPLGLDDLFNLVLRPSPFLRNPDAFGQRLLQKDFLRRWPLLRVSPE